MPSPKQTITAIGMIILGCVVWCNIDMLQVFGGLARALRARVMNVRLCFDVGHVAPYFVRGSSLPLWRAPSQNRRAPHEVRGHRLPGRNMLFLQ